MEHFVAHAAVEWIMALSMHGPNKTIFFLAKRTISGDRT